MGKSHILVGLRGLATASLVVGLISLSFLSTGCQQPSSSSASGTSSSGTGSTLGGSTLTGSSGASGSTSTSLGSTVNAIQIITKADPTGSFDPVSVPLSGGASVKATRIFNLDGSSITVGNVPPWFVE